MIEASSKSRIYIEDHLRLALQLKKMRLNTPHVFRGTRQMNYDAQCLAENTHEKDSFDLGVELHGPQRC
ncbi:hypothetical protein ACN38_g12895 [Penicillium nordicum]|uniref:Uncharacterized protein n=1 Tax=Penicillium nordicum TaxID=229535 RepID=A0A0M9W9J4_9EURO|nr:hypothetical protein ACN38_g12895 [Penicillium nordicum]